jgi:hypothetical protein
MAEEGYIHLFFFETGDIYTLVVARCGGFENEVCQHGNYQLNDLPPSLP